MSALWYNQEEQALVKADKQLEGLLIMFHSNDHEPAHFHCRKNGEWEVRVYIRESREDSLYYQIKWSVKSIGPDKNDIDRLYKYVTENKQSLEYEWKNKVCQS